MCHIPINTANVSSLAGNTILGMSMLLLISSVLAKRFVRKSISETPILCRAGCKTYTQSMLLLLVVKDICKIIHFMIHYILNSFVLFYCAVFMLFSIFSS